MPGLIRHPVMALDAGLRRNDKLKVFNRQVNNYGGYRVGQVFPLAACSGIFIRIICMRT